MRARLPFLLTALTLLSFVQATNALFSILFALSYDGLFPEFEPGWLALAIVPTAALLAPALPFSLWLERSTLMVLAAATTAAARVLLCLPAFPVRYAAATVTVAAGAIFLGKAVGHIDRRSVAAAAAAALVLDQLLRLAGWSYDLSLRPGWLPVQIALGAAAVAAALAWRRDPPREETPDAASLERRAGGVRLRGAMAFGAILFLEMNVLARAEVAHRWLGLPYGLAAFTLIGAGALAVLALLSLQISILDKRRAAVSLALLAGAAAAAVPLGWRGPAPLLLGLWAAGHASALLLLERALVPASGRRRGWRLAAGMGWFFTLNVCWVLTFFYAFTAPILQDGAAAVLLVAALLLAAALALTPRPVPAEPGLQPRLAAALLASLLLTAGVLAARPGPEPRAAVSEDVRVASYNVHYGFDLGWRYDPERIARTIEESGANIVALQEVPAGLITAYGTDLGLWLGRRLDMPMFFAPSLNGLLGDGVLSSLPVLDFTSRLLPPPDADRKQVARLAVRVGTDTLVVYATHFGVHENERLLQVADVLRLAGEPRALLLGDLNAGPGSEPLRLLHAAGFRDAFEGQPGPPTWPATEPVDRIDWILGRGITFRDAVVSPGPGSDHRLVQVRVRPR